MTRLIVQCRAPYCIHGIVLEDNSSLGAGGYSVADAERRLLALVSATMHAKLSASA